jgi:hypothetical protein
VCNWYHKAKGERIKEFALSQCHFTCRSSSSVTKRSTLLTRRDMEREKIFDCDFDQGRYRRRYSDICNWLVSVYTTPTASRS